MRRRVLPHRCQRCRCRCTFDPNRRAPPCPSCGSRLHWTVDAHRAARRDHRRQTCSSPACPYHYPHSRYSPMCIENPRGYGPWDDTEEREWT